MAYLEDLAHWDYFGPLPGTVLSVGWLEPGQPYTVGEVSAEFFDSLVSLLVDPWQPAITAGVFRCPFCRFTGGPAEIQYADTTIRQGVTNLYVPGDHCIYVAPSLIAHYVDSHGYAPPTEFQRAVINCPPMRSVAYLRCVREHGLHKLRDSL